ncbi:hypothetical protein [Mycoplasma bradburyae]|uniref:Haemagglutinin Mycoplasma domain-containing protein n=1 Tax=Mycoplasma bradburyae TaxID=2963128 RepID=A0ABT5GCB0_9MOLU|nr:hypothetical protein [Mycoplasma bradburyae]MDC4182100.1 hypothetical protein [Mycoplasma bradburyae]UTS69826.1 hypothetical protein NMG68_02250 [Mycoplasma bradburyae]
MKWKSFLKTVNFLGVSSLIGVFATSCTGIKIADIKQSDPKSDLTQELPINKNNSDSLINKARKELTDLINTKQSKVNLYKDYAKIKEKLESAYNSSEVVSNDYKSSLEQLEKSKVDLESALDFAASDKQIFDNAHQELVREFNSLKVTLNNKEERVNSLNQVKYNSIKTHLNSLYEVAENIVQSGLQPSEELQVNSAITANTNIKEAISLIDSQKINVDLYSTFNDIAISADNFHGNFKKKRSQPTDFSLIGFGTNLGDFSYKFLKRKINGTSNSDQLTKVSWIYSLEKDNVEQTQASYDINFTYFGGATAILYLPVKYFLSSQTRENTGLQYQVNQKQIIDLNDQLQDLSIEDIKILKINLTDLNWGNNNIKLIMPSEKTSIPAIGNAYISLDSSSENLVYNSIFGNEIDPHNQNKITVNFIKGYGIANRSRTEIKKISAAIDGTGQVTDNYVLGYLGGKIDNSQNLDKNNILYYSFYVNAPIEGMYEISGIYNTQDSRKLVFWTKQYNNQEADGKAQFKELQTENWDSSLKRFDSSKKDENSNSFLKLKQGLNKIIVSGDVNGTNANPAPNLGNVTFTLSTLMNSSK